MLQMRLARRALPLACPRPRRGRGEPAVRDRAREEVDAVRGVGHGEREDAAARAEADVAELAREGREPAREGGGGRGVARGGLEGVVHRREGGEEQGQGGGEGVAQVGGLCRRGGRSGLDWVSGEGRMSGTCGWLGRRPGGGCG